MRRIKRLRITIGILSLIAIAGIAVLVVRARTPSAQYNIAAAGAWFTPEFLKDRSAAYATVDWSDYGYYMVGDYAGRWFNHVGGFRVTSDQPAQATHTLWMFGNSQMYGFTVPDSMTIPSYVQRALPSYRVVNVGVPGSNDTRTSLRRLKSIDVQAGDVVVWMEGLGESRAVYTAAQKQGARIGSAWLDEQLVAMQTRMRDSITAADAYVRSRGGRFVWVLQPHIYSTRLTAGEATLAIDGDLQAAIVLSRPAQQMLTAELGKQGIEVYDFTHIVDPLRNGGLEIYMDDAHFNDTGNEAVATALSSVVARIAIR